MQSGNKLKEREKEVVLLNREALVIEAERVGQGIIRAFL